MFAVCVKDARGREYWCRDGGRDWELCTTAKMGWKATPGLCNPSFCIHTEEDDPTHTSMDMIVSANWGGVYDGGQISMVYRGREGVEGSPTPENPCPTGWRRIPFHNYLSGIYGGGVRVPKDSTSPLCLAFIMERGDGRVYVLDNYGDMYWPLNRDLEKGLGGEIKPSGPGGIPCHDPWPVIQL
ncbi:hypothetical protein KIPB_007925 [Kipferlia bialata]|uniref:Uncharacterized protein n=1 Tax=Kipferlia bialata TaxID=797122 RepID=A0A9K3CZQ9_9EUKA|nr:hypothetical protein KIPB_007925 [Kipferlia bialata]|eukprot:g7925.t1